MMKMMAHKGILADQDRIKIQAECLPKKDDFLQLPKEEMDRILFEREAKVLVKIDALDHQLSAPSKLKYQLFKGRFGRVFLRRKFLSGKYFEEDP